MTNKSVVTQTGKLIKNVICKTEHEVVAHLMQKKRISHISPYHLILVKVIFCLFFIVHTIRLNINITKKTDMLEDMSQFMYPILK